MMRKKLQGMAVVAALLALALAMVTVSCPDPAGGGGGGGGGSATVVEGGWESSDGQNITFSGNSFTWTTEGRLDYKGSFTLSDDGTINFTITQYSDDEGNTWYSENQFIDAKVIEQTGQGVWNLATETMKETLRTSIRMIWKDDLIKTAVGEYELILDDTQLVITYSNPAAKTAGYQKAGTSTVSTALVGKWVIENAPTVIVLDFSTSQLQILRGSTSYTYYTLETDGKIEIGTTPGVFTQDFCTSYTITDNTLTFSGGSSADWYPSASFKKYVFPPFTPTPLTADQWEDGVIGSEGEAWYSFSVTSGTVYRLWWNESGSNGNGTKTLNIQVSGYYSDGTSIFTDTNTAWATAQSFTATSSGTVYVKVTPYSSGGTGTFGIVYSSAATTRPDVTFAPPATALTANQWKDDEITADSGGDAWYSFPVTSGNTFYVWWNESGSNRLKTLDIRVSAFNSDGTSVTGFSSIDTAWSTEKSFTPTLDGTVYLRVTPYTSGSTGTYGIVYSASNTRPDVSIGPSNKTALTADQWANGSITAPNGEAWYSFPVTSGTTYRLWGNGSGSGAGNGLFKTLVMRVNAWYSNGDNIFYNIESPWGTARTITPDSNGTVYVRVTPATSSDIGTFGIVYSADTVRPNVPLNPPEPPNPITLTADEWKNGEITNSNREVWYSFSVTSGSYYLWSNDGGSSSGDGWSKTLSNAQISAWYSDGTSLFTNASNMWSTARTISPTSNTTVYVRVTTSSTANGTYGIVYTTVNTRPFDAPSNTTVLTANEWKNGAIPNGSDNFVWYSFTVTGGTTYRLWWNESGTTYGDGSKTLNVSAAAFYSDGTSIGTWSDAWSTARTISPTSNGTVYVRVYPSTSGNAGTFGIVYSNTSSIRPNVPFTPPANVNITTLTDGQWKDDEITTANGEAWYSFPVSSGTSYRLWWNESSANTNDYTKTLHIRVDAWHSNNGDTKVVDAYSSIWSSPSGFTAASNGTVYVKVTPVTSGNTGTYGIVYSTAATMPGLPINPTNVVTLTDRQWQDGEIATGGEAWYSFEVTSGTTYYLWWNGAGGTGYGNNTKTLRTRVNAYYSDGTFILSENSSYLTIPPKSFTASSSGTVYLRVIPLSPVGGYSGGTFGIVYGIGSTTMPTVP